MLKSEYLQQVNEFVTWAKLALPRLKICHVVLGRGKGIGSTFEAVGIDEVVNKYQWPCRIDEGFLPRHFRYPVGINSSLAFNMQILEQLKIELRESLSNEEARRHFRACLAILSWGGVDDGARATNVRFYAKKYVQDTEHNSLLEYHKKAHDGSGWANPIVANDERLLMCEKMSSGITKIHALLDDELVIYDSRVAAGLGYLIELYCADMNLEKIPYLLQLSLPTEQGKNGGDSGKKSRNPADTRPSLSKVTHQYKQLNKAGNDKANRRIDEEWMRCQLRASWILSDILNRSLTPTPSDPPAKPQKHNVSH